MGSTATAWATQVSTILRDASGVDIVVADVLSLGVQPAIIQYSIDRPRSVAVDLTPSARYLPLPSAGQGWMDGWSQISLIEAPSGQTPPARLADSQWSITRDPSTPATVRVLLPYTLAASESARVHFTSTWPFPDGTAGTDLIPSVAFLPICHLAAALISAAFGNEAARSRQGAMPTDFVDGSERTRDLLDVAANLRIIYNTFVGLGSIGSPAGSSSPSRTLSSVRMRT